MTVSTARAPQLETEARRADTPGKGDKWRRPRNGGKGSAPKAAALGYPKHRHAIRRCYPSWNPCAITAIGCFANTALGEGGPVKQAREALRSVARRRSARLPDARRQWARAGPRTPPGRGGRRAASPPLRRCRDRRAGRDGSVTGFQEDYAAIQRARHRYRNRAGTACDDLRRVPAGRPVLGPPSDLWRGPLLS